MKTFNDLEFRPHSAAPALDTHAQLFFENGYGVSVVSGRCVSGGSGYELAVITSDGLHYDNPVAEGDVVGGLSESNVTALMAQVQAFDPYQPPLDNPDPPQDP